MNAIRPVHGALLVLLMLAAGCAKKGPPSGGPPDVDRPRVLESDPDSGAAGVAVGGPIRITFTEPMEPRVTAESAELAPRVAIRQRRWNGRMLTLELGESLAVNRTYTLFLSGTARDRHGNPMSVGRTVPFTTGAEFPAGRLEGKIEARGFTAAGTYLWSYEAARTGVPDSTARDFDAIGVANERGEFAIPGLPVPGRYRLWAFADLNANRSFEPDHDVLAPADTTIELTPGRPVGAGLLLRITNPRATARVAGAVLDTLGDSLGLIRVIAHSESDTLRRLLVEAGSRNGFEFLLEAGVWTLQAWRDLDRDKQWDLDEEPASDDLRIEVGPADELKDVVLVLRKPPGVRSSP